MQLFRNLKRAVLVLLSRLTKRIDNNNVMFIPHENGDIDGYDIINYHSDNVYCLFNYMIRQERFSNYTFYVLVNDLNKVPSYIDYCNENNRGSKIVFIKRDMGSKQFLDYFFSCGTIFTTHMFLSFGLKRKHQNVVCLGYFTPFKNDFVWTSCQFKDWIRSSNRNYSYHISTSDFSSRILSSDNGLYYNKFLPFGMPRNDLLVRYKVDDPLIKRVSEEYKRFDKIIIYTPTYRDYEETNKNVSRSVFGYNNNIQPLIKVLEKHNAVLIVKLHPLQNRSIIDDLKSNNIVAYNSYQNNYSLYDLLCIADILITDYTSTYFDYLLLNRPVLFNFYDKDEYQKTRGFAISNIEELCAGPIVSSFEDFVLNIDCGLSGKDDYQTKRKWVNMLINLHRDGRSAERISDYFFN